MSTWFISTVFFTIIEFVFPGFFPLVFVDHWQLLRSQVKGKNILSSKIEFTKRYWISKKNKNVTCAIGWFFIIVFSFTQWKDSLREKCPNTELFLVCIYLSRSVCLSKYVLCLRHLKITNVFSLYKFHNCRIMQLRHFKKLEMC